MFGKQVNGKKKLINGHTGGPSIEQKIVQQLTHVYSSDNSLSSQLV